MLITDKGNLEVKRAVFTFGRIKTIGKRALQNQPKGGRIYYGFYCVYTNRYTNEYTKIDKSFVVCIILLIFASN